MRANHFSAFIIVAVCRTTQGESPKSMAGADTPRSLECLAVCGQVPVIEAAKGLIKLKEPYPTSVVDPTTEAELPTFVRVFAGKIISWFDHSSRSGYVKTK